VFAQDSTAVNVQLLVNVCMVWSPLVVIVHHVEVLLIQSLPSVAYDIITIQLPQAHQSLFIVPFTHPHQPQPVLAVPAVPATQGVQEPAHHHQFPQAQAVLLLSASAHQPHHQA